MCGAAARAAPTLAAAPPRARASHRTPLAAHRSAARAVYSMYHSTYICGRRRHRTPLLYIAGRRPRRTIGHARRIDRTRDTAAL
jgi:hypothetical protein